MKRSFWLSRKLSIGLVSLYALWLLVGSIVQYDSYRDYDSTSPGKAVFLLTAKDHVIVRGQFSVHGASSEPWDREFVGDLLLEVGGDASDPRRVRMLLEIRDVRYSDELLVKNRQGGPEQAITALYRRQVALETPLEPGENRIDFDHSNPRARTQILSVELLRADQQGKRPAVDFVEVEGAGTALGSGWFLPTQPARIKREASATILSWPSAFLRLPVPAPGRFEIKLPFERVRRIYHSPRFTLNGEPVQARITQVDGKEWALLQAGLETEAIVGVHLRGKPVNGGRRVHYGNREFYSFKVDPRSVSIRKLD